MKNFILSLSVIASSSFAFANQHEVFVCQSNNTSTSKGITMFAAKQDSYCRLDTDYNGQAYGQFFCYTDNTQTAITMDHQKAILFTQNLGSGAYLRTQLNFPTIRTDGRAFSGTMRFLSNQPGDLKQPISKVARTGVENVVCSQKLVNFQD